LTGNKALKIKTWPNKSIEVNHNHIIQKVFIEITVSNKEKAHYIKDDINSFLSIDVFPEIEKYINDLEAQLHGHTVQIPRLKLDLDVKNSSLDSELKNKITELFKEQLSEIIRPGDVSDEKTEHRSKPYWVNNKEKMLQTFIYFLENGLMPWWNSGKEGMDLLETTVFADLIATPGFQKNIIPVLPKQYVQERIINQLSDEQIAQLCLTILENKDLQINLDIIVKSHYLSSLNPAERTFIWRLVFLALIKYLHSSEAYLREYLSEHVSKENPELFRKKISHKTRKTLAQIFPFIEENKIFEGGQNQEDNKNTEIISNTHKDDEENILKTPSRTKDQKPKEIGNDGIPDDGQYVQNAGLVLIHPFIKTFFEHCDLLNKETQKLTDPELCAHLLHYVATGNINAPEYEMIFEKFLCNIPMHQSINKHIKLSRKHKNEAKNVIESVLHNWSPMKKSSPALLQNEFFQRPGKLVVTEYDYTLTVERKTQDILMDKLSWGIGFVKLPWKEKFMLVNW